MKLVCLRCGAARGFTLVETLIVMVVLGIAAVSVVSLQGNIFNGRSANRDIVVGAQLMQECAELLLAKGRVTYGDSCLASSAAATTCCATTSVGAYSAPTVTISTGNATTLTAACPYTTTGSTDCKLITVTQGGLSPVILMLANH